MPDVIADLGDYTSPPVPSVTDKTTADLIAMVRAYLTVGRREERDKLAESVTENATTLETTYERPAIKAGARLNIGLEDFHVWDVDGSTVTVQPGEFGSSSAAHAAGDIIHVNPEFSQFDIFRELNNELRGLSAPRKLFRVAQTTLTYNSATFGYDLTDVSDMRGVLSVLATTVGSDANREPITDWRVEHGVDTASFPSGVALFTGRGYPGRAVTVNYKTGFGELSSLSDAVSATTGLPTSAYDVLAMGAALRLADPAEIGRNQVSAQGSSRRANEVPPGSRTNAPRVTRADYMARLSEERNDLERQWPTRLPRRV